MDFATLFHEAHAAGMLAGTAVTPEPMVVQEVGLDDRPFPGARTYHVPEGVCGFAWVRIKGNTAFGRWCKTEGKARPDYPTGLAISCHEFNQSMTRKEAYAHAFAEVLRAAGIQAHAQSRLD